MLAAAGCEPSGEADAVGLGGARGVEGKGGKSARVEEGENGRGTGIGGVSEV